MYKWRIYFRMDGDVIVEAETEEEAREKFYDLDSHVLSGNTYVQSPEIDDLSCEGEA